MSTFLTFLKIEGKLVWKSIDILIFGICFPIILATLFGYFLSKDGLAGASNFELSYASVITIGVLATGVMGVPLTIADYRHRGILRRFQVTPVSPLQILFAQGLIQLSSALVSFIGVTLVYHLLFDYELKGSWGIFLLTYTFVIIAMYSIGIFIGSLVPDQKSANVWTSVAYFTMLLFSGATIPYEAMPRFFQWVMDILPLSHGIHLLKQASTGEPLTDGLFHIVILALCIVIGLCGSIKFFKWK
ncbi:multidrug ABC transporter permease [Brevibacillus laterosporus]|uniref:ABC transporter permease n=1 Tax=Brevibacillus laterosporus TaxID=1465 RepID=UPI000BD7172E|nr:ABC transporter permease [Brevibacillus laterosporus]PCN43811.1 multidrug ABC transporter permease [Brevibacillus laterosporus]